MAICGGAGAPAAAPRPPRPRPAAAAPRCGRSCCRGRCGTARRSCARARCAGGGLSCNRASAGGGRRCRACWRRARCCTCRSRCTARAGCRGRRRCGTHPHVALRARVRAVGPQAFNRIDDEGQRLEFDRDRFDRLGRCHLVDRGDGENRLALIERLVGQAALGLRARLHAFAKRRADGGAGQVVGGEDRLHAGHRQRRARVELLDARVRHRAEQQLGEQHAFDAVVLGVLRLARDLGDEVGRRVVLADQFVISHYAFLMCSAPRISAVRILS